MSMRGCKHVGVPPNECPTVATFDVPLDAIRDLTSANMIAAVNACSSANP